MGDAARIADEVEHPYVDATDVSQGEQLCRGLARIDQDPSPRDLGDGRVEVAIGRDVLAEELTERSRCASWFDEEGDVALADN